MVKSDSAVEPKENTFYGHDLVLKRYAKAGDDRVIPGFVTHGWHFGSGIYGDLIHKYKNARYFVFNRRNVSLARSFGFKNVTPIGAPFLLSLIHI